MRLRAGPRPCVCFLYTGTCPCTATPWPSTLTSPATHLTAIGFTLEAPMVSGRAPRGESRGDATGSLLGLSQVAPGSGSWGVSLGVITGPLWWRCLPGRPPGASSPTRLLREVLSNSADNCPSSHCVCVCVCVCVLYPEDHLSFLSMLRFELSRSGQW